MTIINVNSISGINSITAQGASGIEFYNSSGRVNGNISGSTTDILHIQGINSTVRAKIESTAANSYPGLRLTNDARSYDLQIDGATDALRVYDSTASQERLRITSAGLVGIGTDAPDAKLNVYQSDSTGYNTTSDQRSEAEIRIHNPLETEGTFSSINFYNGGGVGGDISLNAVKSGTDYLSHFTIKQRSGGGSNDWRERFRIHSDGNIGIGTDNPYNSKLQVFGKTRISASAKDLTTDFFVLSSNENNTNTNELIFRQRAADNDWEIEAVEQGVGYRNVWIKNGNLKFTDGKGIDFSAVEGSGALTNGSILHDYEEGTWTPAFNAGGTLSVHGAHYTRIGRMVNVYLYIHSIASIPNNSTQFEIGGLPFTALNGQYYSPGVIGYTATFDASPWVPVTVNNGNYIYFHRIDGNHNTAKNSDFTGIANFLLGVTYVTNA